MPDYKALYFALFRANAAAAQQLLAAQLQAEDAFCAAEPAPVRLCDAGEGQKTQPPQKCESAGQSVNGTVPKVP